MTPLSAASHEEVVGFFRDAAEELKRILDGADTSQPYGRYRREQFGAIAAALVKLDEESKQWLDDNFPQLMADAAAETKQEIRDQGEEDFLFRFAGVPQEAVRVLTEQTYLDFGKTVAALQRDGQRAVLNKYMIQRSIVRGTIEGASVSRTKADILKSLDADTIGFIRYRNGREVRVEDYVDMLVRTQTMNAYNVSAAQQMLAAGRRYGVFPTIPSQNREADDPCWEWEKRKFVDLLSDPLPPASTHPNCRHRIRPATMEELKAERPDLYELAMAYFRQARG